VAKRNKSSAVMIASNLGRRALVFEEEDLFAG
jgi:hypothetical protein